MVDKVAQSVRIFEGVYFYECSGDQSILFGETHSKPIQQNAFRLLAAAEAPNDILQEPLQGSMYLAAGWISSYCKQTSAKQQLLETCCLEGSSRTPDFASVAQ